MMLKKYLLILVGSVSWVLTMFKSGLPSQYGIGFWGANGHDGVWHIALAESLSKFGLSNPVFSGFALKNYHLGFDIFLVILNRLTGIRMDTLYFQVIPVVFSIAIGYLIYQFVLLWTKSEKSALYSTFFTYFGGSLSYLIGKGESAFWSQQAISTLINPPYALSLILILLGLNALLKNKYVYATLFFSVLIFVKVYAGLLVLTGLFVVAIYHLYRKYDIQYIKIFISTLFLSLVIYLSFNKISPGLIIFQPFWFLESMMQLSDHVGWAKFGEAMVNYRIGNVWSKALLSYMVAFAIFFIGNFGLRLIFIKEMFKKLDTVKIFILCIILTGILIPTFFVQSGTPWNTIQFLYYSLFFSGILAGIAVSKVNTMIIHIIVVLFTIPTTILTLKDVYIPSRPPAKISNQELSGLKFLSEQSSGVVLTYPFDADKAKEAINNPPRPLYLYVSTAYVSAFSKHQTFLEDENNLTITGYNWTERRKEIEAWYKQTDQGKARQFLKDNNIKYVYWVKPQRALLGESQLGLTNIFENNEVNVYMVKLENE